MVPRSALALVVFLPFVSSQSTNATCVAGWDWTFNTMNQSPCLVSAYLNLPCDPNPADAFLNKLPGFGVFYDFAGNSDCFCNTVYFSMINACEYCQGYANVSWSNWKSSCTNPVISKFPKPIPTGTAIPAWAYLDVVSSDEFSVANAKAFAEQDHPDSSAVSATPTSSGSSTSAKPSSASSHSAASMSSSSSPSPSATAASDTSNSHKKSLVGPIVGGVIGGLALIGLVLGAGFFLWSHKKTSRSRAAPTLPLQSQGSPTYAPVSEVSKLRVYDPDDPSTFPSIGSSYRDLPESSTYHDHDLVPGTMVVPTRNLYSGLPEPEA